MVYLHSTVWIAAVKFDPMTKWGFINFNNSPQFAMAQISIKILLERFTDVRGPVNDSSCLRKPREP